MTDPRLRTTRFVRTLVLSVRMQLVVWMHSPRLDLQLLSCLTRGNVMCFSISVSLSRPFCFSSSLRSLWRSRLCFCSMRLASSVLSSPNPVHTSCSTLSFSSLLHSLSLSPFLRSLSSSVSNFAPRSSLWRFGNHCPCNSSFPAPLNKHPHNSGRLHRVERGPRVHWCVLSFVYLTSLGGVLALPSPS